MNVAFDPWIPVVTTAGKPDMASLCTVLTEGEKYTDLAVRPHERVALMRLFLCVAHAALDGPKNYKEWCKFPEMLPDAARFYLNTWKDSFELFHSKKPWLQVAKLEPIPLGQDDKRNDKEWSSLNRLCFTRSSGITTTLFDHPSNSEILTEYTCEEIILNLLTFQNYFVAGGKASSRQWGELKMLNPPNPRGGPCSGKSIIFTFLRGHNLTESIHMNINTYEDLSYAYGNIKDWLGKPIWEKPITSPNDQDAIINATQTHIGRLVPQTRILRINQDRKRVLLGAGFVYPKFQDEKNTFHPDIFATVVTTKKGERTLLSARPNNAIWRVLHSLTVRLKNASDSNRGPLCLLNVSGNNSCDIIVDSMLTNPKQAAEIVDLIESVFHIPALLLTQEGFAAYEEEVAQSEIYKNRLGFAIEEYRKEIDGTWENKLEKAKQDKWILKEKLHAIATINYWTTIEKNLMHLMAHIKAIGTDDAMQTREVWRKMLSATACEAYCVACGRETSRQMRAFAKGWQILTI